jgi:hypothetical protein
LSARLATTPAENIAELARHAQQTSALQTSAFHSGWRGV